MACWRSGSSDVGVAGGICSSFVFRVRSQHLGHERHFLRTELAQDVFESGRWRFLGLFRHLLSFYFSDFFVVEHLSVMHGKMWRQAALRTDHVVTGTFTTALRARSHISGI